MGLKEDYLQAISKSTRNSTYGRCGTNHKAAADHMEAFQVISGSAIVNFFQLSEPFTINGWTHFTFRMVAKTPTMTSTGTGTISGTDYDAAVSLAFTWSRYNKGWANEELVDNENVTTTTFMYADLHPEVIQNI